MKPSNKEITKEQKSIFDFINRFNFGIIISTIDNIPTATHLPFVVEMDNGKLILTSHMASSNAQSKHIDNNKNLIIFS